MHKHLLSLIILLLPLVSTAADTEEELLAEARALTDEFIGRLKPQLKKALQTQGPAGAIAVCADVAPTLADSLSYTSGWTVKRVSLRARNASRAIPDPWETERLSHFEAKAASSGTTQILEHGELLGNRFRYLRAQSIEPVCLTCHGRELSPEVTQALDSYYPDDAAIGYDTGNVRGAISLSRTIEQSK